MIKKINFKQKKYLISLLLVFILVLLLSLGFAFRSNLELFLSQTRFNQSSTADISTSGSSLNFKFDLNSKDQALASEFAANLGVEPKIFQGFSMEIDAASIEKLSKTLPAHLMLKFEPKKLTLSSRNFSLLNSGLPKYDYQLATQSSQLSLKGSDQDKFNLEIQEPEPLLIYATSSGQLHLSKKLDSLYPTLQKIARMKLEVNGQSLNGEIILK